MKDGKITLTLDDLTNEEMMMILEHRSSEQKKSFWSREWLYWYKEVRRNLVRRVMDYTIIYLLIKYGMTDLFKF